MTQPQNIIEFNALAGRVLLALYESHPIPIDLDALNYLQLDDETDPKVFGHAVEWLSNEGYLRYKAKFTDYTLGYVQLTEKGLGTLTRPLGALDAKGSKQTIGSQLKAAVAAGAGNLGLEAAKLEMARIFAQAFG